MAELLAPAGSSEAFKAAVESGADAVYLAGTKFGARAYAENFTSETLKAAIRYAHLRRVQVHVTVNTLVLDNELDEVADYLRELYDSGADAVLVQDLGVAKVAREVVPQLPLHASTQMTVTNLASVRALAELGFARAVLAREMSLKDIAAICQGSPIEIEVFMHGALCVCYSGQCLMSSMIGARSGNRGRCAQPCRLPYALTDESGQSVLPKDIPAPAYLLSPKDLNTIELLPELLSAGVASLKIEGRMKRPEYVATVVGTYRAALDRAAQGQNYDALPQEKTTLAQIFNRDFTTAYLKNLPGRGMMSYLRPNNRGIFVGRVTAYNKDANVVCLKLTQNLNVGDQVDFWVKVGGRVNVTITELRNKAGQSVPCGHVGDEVSFSVPAAVHIHDRAFKILDVKLNETAKAAFTGASKRKIPLNIQVRATVGEPLVLHGKDAEGCTGTARTDFVGQAAKNRPLTPEILHKQLSRLGDTVFELRYLQTQITGNVMVPVSEINEARRRLTAELECKRLARYNRPKAKGTLRSLPAPLDRKPTAIIVAVTDTLAQVKAALSAGAGAILFGGDTYDHRLLAPSEYESARELAQSHGKPIFFATPRIILPEHRPYAEKLLTAWSKLPPTEIYAHSLGVFNLARQKLSCPVHVDYALPAANREALAFWRESGASGVTLSPELTLEQVEVLAKTAPLPLECLVAGRLELMISRYCAAGSFLGNVGQKKCSQPCRTRKLFLRDRKDIYFPLGFDGFCQMHVLNGKSLSMLPYVGRLVAGGISRLRLEMKGLSAGEVGDLVQKYVSALNGTAAPDEPPDITRGHYFRGV